MRDFNFDLQKEEFEREKTIRIISPLPLSVEWHRITNWRHAEELYTNYLSTWNKWKKKSFIPNWVIERVENNG